MKISLLFIQLAYFVFNLLAFDPLSPSFPDSLETFIVIEDKMRATVAFKGTRQEGIELWHNMKRLPSFRKYSVVAERIPDTENAFSLVTYNGDIVKALESVKGVLPITDGRINPDNLSGEISVSGKQYVVLDRLHGGASAHVYKIKSLSSGQLAVLKIPYSSSDCEATNMKKIALHGGHPNIVRLIDTEYRNDKEWIVMEYVEGRTLEQLHRDMTADEKYQYATAVEFLRNIRIEHYGVENVRGNTIIDRFGNVKLIDFGSCAMK